MPYSFLSGSTIDANLFFEAVSSGDCFLGFARSTPVWGNSALVRVQHNPSLAWPVQIVGQSAQQPAGDPYFFDKNSYAGVTNADRTVYLYRTPIANADFNLTGGSTVQDNPSGGVFVGQMVIDYLSKGWARIQGMSPRIAESIDTTQYKYYLAAGYQGGSPTIVAKILPRSVVDIASYSQECILTYKNGVTFQPVDVSVNGLTLTRNTLGEQVVRGFDSNTAFDTNLLTMEFAIRDSSNSVTLIGNMELIPGPTETTFENGTETYLKFRYTVDRIDPLDNTVSQVDVYLKVTDAASDLTQLAIYHESHIHETSVPVADNNPPALEITYLRSPALDLSISNVVGMNQIVPNEVWFVREIELAQEAYYDAITGVDIETFAYAGGAVREAVVRTTTLAGAGVQTIPVLDGFSVGIGDVIWLNGGPITIDGVDATPGSASIHLASDLTEDLTVDTVLKAGDNADWVIVKYAKTQDIDLAREVGMNLVMVVKDVPCNPTYYQGIYRQLFVSYKPNASYGPLSTTWDGAKYKYDIGTLLYLANKQPVYRKYVADGVENFKIII